MSSQETRNKRWDQIQRDKKRKRKYKNKDSIKGRHIDLLIVDEYETLDSKVQKALDNYSIPKIK